MIPGFTPTWMHWYNSTEKGKLATADIGSYEAIPYGGVHPGMKHVTDQPPHPTRGQWQWGLACSKTSRTIVADIDHPDEWEDSHTFIELGPIAQCATSFRTDGEKFHVVITVPEELVHLWPTQGPTLWGDVKSNGFSYHEGIHHTEGLEYKASVNEWITADEELLRALQEDRVYPQGQFSGASAGRWAAEGYEITGDNQLAADIMSMVAWGLDREQIYARLAVILKPLTNPWTQADIDHKINTGEEKVAKRRWEEQQRDESFAEGFEEAFGKDLTEHLTVKSEQIAAAMPKLPTTLLPQGISVNYASLQGGTDAHIAHQLLSWMPEHGYAHTNDTDSWFLREGTAWSRLPKSPCRTFVVYVGSRLPYPQDTNFDPGVKVEPNDPELQAKKLWLKLNMNTGATALASMMEAAAPLFPSVCSVNESQMDANPLIFWAGGVPYSLRTLEPSGDPNAPHQLEAGYAPAAGDTPIWDALNEAQFPDAEMREYAQNVFASILPGGANKLLPNFKAEGNLGKTTRLALLVDLLGAYAVQLPVQLLGNYSGHDEMYLRLKGKRLAYLDETPPAGKVAAEKLKNLSGGGSLTGRAINGRTPITFKMQHTLILAGNDDLPLTDPNVQRRVRYLPITGSVKDIARVSVPLWDHGDLCAAWRAEAPAVLWKLMQRAQAVLAEPRLCDMPAGALDHFATAIIEQDTIAEFIKDACTQDGETNSNMLHEHYVAWCQRHNIRETANLHKFGRRLTEMGYEKRHTVAGNVRPLRVRPSAMI